MALAKALAKYAKDNPEFSFKSGVVEGRAVSIQEIDALATMPSKQEIYAKLLFLVNAPAESLVRAVNAVGRNLAVVLGQGVEKQKFASGKFSGQREPPERMELSVFGGCGGFSVRERCLALQAKDPGRTGTSTRWRNQLRRIEIRTSGERTWRICSNWKTQSWACRCSMRRSW